MNSKSVVLELRDISRVFVSGDEQLRVLDHANFVLHRKEVVAMMAPSGSGKSTFLQIAGLLDTPDRGCVIIGGEDAFAKSEQDRTDIRRSRVGFVYQFHHLLSEFTAIENVILPQMTNAIPFRQASMRAKDLLERFGLSDRLDHLPGKLSGGERQRVAIARALANHPHVLLADEPTGNLDSRTSQHVFDELMMVVRTEGLATLVATHNRDLARRMDRIVTLQDGKIVPVNDN